jgi:tetratricopeptide (TPR) repeat protein
MLLTIAPPKASAREASQPDTQFSAALDQARQAYDASQYQRCVELLQSISANHSQAADAALWMTKCYYELRQFDAAISCGEKAVELQPNSSLNHMWLGRSYGRKAERAGMLSAMSLAKKARREFEASVRSDPGNFEAQQDLIEYYCSAPAIVGGGEEKAQKQITALAALDPAEAHFARAECWSDQKNWDYADNEFLVALHDDQKRPFVVFEIADYFLTRRRTHHILEAAAVGAKLAPNDPRVDFYRGVALVLENQNLAAAEIHLKNYLATAPRRMAYPSESAAHEWLGRLYERQGRAEAAKEFHAALAADPQNKAAREALKRLPK